MMDHGEKCGASRRQFLAVMAATSAAALLPSGLFAQNGASQAGRIDIHAHLFSPAYRKRVPASAGNARSDPALLNWTPARALEDMDKNGVAAAMLSIAVGGISFDQPGEEARSLARGNNEYGAQMARDYPGRFGLFASLPLPDQDGSLKEIEYAFDTLKADGIALTTNYGDKWPGDPAFAPVLEELNRRRAVVFVHPISPDCCTRLIPGVPPAWIEYDFDTSRAIVSLLVNGAFTRYPNLRFIFTHSGGTIPMLVSRLNGVMPKQVAGDRAPNGVPAEIKKLYFDVANGANPASLSALMETVPVSQVLFGTDFPFVPIHTTTDGLAAYKFSASDLQAIHRDNALRLLPRLRG